MNGDPLDVLRKQKEKGIKERVKRTKKIAKDSKIDRACEKAEVFVQEKDNPETFAKDWAPCWYEVADLVIRLRMKRAVKSMVLPPDPGYTKALELQAMAMDGHGKAEFVANLTQYMAAVRDEGLSGQLALSPLRLFFGELRTLLRNSNPSNVMPKPTKEILNRAYTRLADPPEDEVLSVTEVRKIFELKDGDDRSFTRSSIYVARKSGDKKKHQLPRRSRDEVAREAGRFKGGWTVAEVRGALRGWAESIGFQLEVL